MNVFRSFRTLCAGQKAASMLVVIAGLIAGFADNAWGQGLVEQELVDAQPALPAPFFAPRPSRSEFMNSGPQAIVTPGHPYSTAGRETEPGMEDYPHIFSTDVWDPNRFWYTE